MTSFFSGISMEVYLSHMVKLELLNLFASDLLSYLATSVGTLVGAVVFSTIAQKVLDVVWMRLLSWKK